MEFQSEPEMNWKRIKNDEAKYIREFRVQKRLTQSANGDIYQGIQEHVLN